LELFAMNWTIGIIYRTDLLNLLKTYTISTIKQTISTAHKRLFYNFIMYELFTYLYNYVNTK